jgi:hypothetical protein
MPRLGEVDGTVIVAVIAMWMVEMTIDEVIDVIAMRHGLMSTSRPMHMSGLMTTAPVIWRAPIWVFRAHLDRVLLDDIARLMMQMPVMQVVDMTAVLHRDMAAAYAVLVRMVGMVTCRHRPVLSESHGSSQGAPPPKGLGTPSRVLCF